MEFAETPDAKAARSHLEERLRRLAPAELEAFWAAVRRCYASALDDATEESAET